ncbi:MAG: universal stress protein, partial [Chloroflexi bacterium]|nr:universal stress protein [Chloroflexota bacterium]
SQVLSAEEANAFKFEDQERLHDEIIDEGLEKVYGGFLQRAAQMVADSGVPFGTLVLPGKAYDRLAAYAQEVGASLLVVGRLGAQREAISPIGSTCENVLRLAQTNVLVVGEPPAPPAVPELAAPQCAELPWDDAALARLLRVPQFARGMAKRAVEARARGQGLPRVTEAFFEQAVGAMGRHGRR